jgi:hypothetical protein
MRIRRSTGVLPRILKLKGLGRDGQHQVFGQVAGNGGLGGENLRGVHVITPDEKISRGGKQKRPLETVSHQEMVAKFPCTPTSQFKL